MPLDGWMDRSTSTQSARPVWNLKGRGIVTEQDSSPKLWRQRWLLLILNNIQLLWLNLLSPCTAVSFNAGNIGCFLPKLNGHQGSKGPKVCAWLSRFPDEQIAKKEEKFIAFGFLVSIIFFSKWSQFSPVAHKIHTWSNQAYIHKAFFRFIQQLSIPQRYFQARRVSRMVLLGVDFLQVLYHLLQAIVVPFVQILFTSTVSHRLSVETVLGDEKPIINIESSKQPQFFY